MVEKRKGFGGEPSVTGMTLPNCFALVAKGLGGLSVTWKGPELRLEGE